MSRESSVALTAMLVAAGACGGGPVAPGDIRDTLSIEVQTQSIIFRFSPGDAVDNDWQQAFHDWITGQLGVQLPTRLKYYKYRGRAQIQAVTGRATNGFAEPAVNPRLRPLGWRGSTAGAAERSRPSHRSGGCL